eukprot:1704829-Pyramimonas_sp.AAC.1
MEESRPQDMVCLMAGRGVPIRTDQQAVLSYSVQGSPAGASSESGVPPNQPQVAAGRFAPR